MGEAAIVLYYMDFMEDWRVVMVTIGSMGIMLGFYCEG
jgi:hypothetical protein